MGCALTVSTAYNYGMTDLQILQDKLLATIRDYGSCAVAFSAGVDSTVVAKAAQLALGDDAIAVTADSPSQKNICRSQERHSSQEVKN